jgi:hypothetical protein
LRSILLPIVITAGVLVAGAASAADVMIVATYHMASPGQDLHNFKADDVLRSNRQHELLDVARALATFKPTLVAVESPARSGEAAKVDKYTDYLDNRLPDSRNEVVQIGFRLARMLNLREVWGIDVEGDFPYDAVKQFAAAHPPALPERLDAMNASVERMLDGLNRVLANGTIGAGLRYMNDPKRIADGQAFYRGLLLFGAGPTQPGTALLDAWESRNNAICARLVQLVKRDDRVIIVYGAGHAYLLRQCVREMPGFNLVEANDYLPH